MSESSTPSRFPTLDALLAKLAAAGWKEREAIKEELLAEAQLLEPLSAVIERLRDGTRGVNLEVRWEIEEVMEAIAPPPPPVEEAPPEPPEDPNKPLSMSDLNLVYDDPRGLQLFKTKKGERWYAMEMDQATGRPQMFEVPAAQVVQIKGQLKGSPYWVLGTGENPSL